MEESLGRVPQAAGFAPPIDGARETAGREGAENEDQEAKNNPMKKLSLLFLLIAAAVVGLPGPEGPLGNSVPLEAAVRPPKLTYERLVLPNGMKVILHQDKSTPIVHVELWYHVGSKNEKPGRTGFAHFFEHMMFKGSRNVEPEQIGRASCRERV